jgi:hypothetical protein
MKRISFCVPDSMYWWLERLADEQGIRVEGYASRVLHDKVASHAGTGEGGAMDYEALYKDAPKWKG